MADIAAAAVTSAAAAVTSAAAAVTSAAATATAMMAERTDDAHNGRRCCRGIGSIGSIGSIIPVRVPRRRPLDFFFRFLGRRIVRADLSRRAHIAWVI
jgi:hypothetical protein